MYFVVQVENATAASTKAIAAWLSELVPNVSVMPNVLYAQIASNSATAPTAIKKADAQNYIDNIRTLTVVGRSSPWPATITKLNVSTDGTPSVWDETVPMAWQRVASTTGMSVL